MSDGWGVLAALGVILLPMALAWWLLGLPGRRRRLARGAQAPRGKMP